MHRCKHLTSKKFIFSLTTTPTHIPHSSSVYVSTGPVTGESPAEESGEESGEESAEESGEESGDGDLNIKQNITHTINPKLVTYILYLLQIISLYYPPPPTSPHHHHHTHTHTHTQPPS